MSATVHVIVVGYKSRKAGAEITFLLRGKDREIRGLCLKDYLEYPTALYVSGLGCGIQDEAFLRGSTV